MLLLRVIHGSHLYGTAHENSDLDIYEVHDVCRARQTIRDGLDVTRFPLSRFLMLCDKGVPQALEAMFAPPSHTEVDMLSAYRLGYRANIPNARDTYARTIKNFGLAPDAKKQRHARRLTMNLAELCRTGRFDPTRRTP